LTPNYEFKTKIYNQRVPAGVWVYMESRLYVGGRPCPSCEIWCTVDDNWMKSTITYDTGLFWFWFRSRAGIYRIRFHAFKVRWGDKEYILSSPEYKIVVYPRPLNLSPLSYEVKVFRRISFDEAYAKVKSIVPFMRKMGYQKIYMCGGLVSRGYSYHDIDLYPVPYPKNVEEIQDTLRKITLMPIEIRKPNPNEKCIEVK